MKVVGYVCKYRWESIDTIPEQRSNIREYIEANLRDAEWDDYYFADRDIGKQPLRQRDAGVAMMAALAPGDHVVVVSPTRIACAAKEFLTAARLITQEAFLHVLSLGLSTRAASGQHALDVAEGLLGESWGVPVGGRVPIGYTRRVIDGRTHLLPEHTERHLAEWFFELHQSGLTGDKIRTQVEELRAEVRGGAKAEYLNPRTAKPFTAGVVHDYIEAYKHGFPVNGESEEQLAARRAAAVIRNRESVGQ